MTKSDIISILKANKGYIHFPEPLKLKGPKKEVTAIDLIGEQVRVYHQNGVTDIDHCESEVIETISEYLKNMEHEQSQSNKE